jgi:hypothetical protein
MTTKGDNPMTDPTTKSPDVSTLPIVRQLRNLSATLVRNDDAAVSWNAAATIEELELALVEAKQFVEAYPARSKQDRHGKDLMLAQIERALAKVSAQ